MSHYEGMGGFGGCPTTACVIVGGEKGFPRATFGSGIKGRQKNKPLKYKYGELTNAFGVKEIKSKPGVAWGMGNCAETIPYIVNLTVYELIFSLNFS